MSYEAKLVAPFDGGGLQQYYKPWLIGHEAFPRIEDAYPWRGSVRKREGYSLLGTIPTTPVQGLTSYLIPATGDSSLIAFSKTKAYLFNNGSSTFSDISFLQTSGAAFSWTGGNDNYFWSQNYANALWTTNFVDPIRFYNGNPVAGWSNQIPVVSGSTTMTACLMLIPYKGRLVVLNTVEGGVAFRQRARWCQIGTPYVPANGADPVVVPPSPFSTQADAWRSDIPGKGGYTDADTSERIISCGIVRDTLIVFFQKSTWRLRYTGYQIQPFIWERINTQYGSESTFSSIPFDDHILTYSRYGYIAADTNSVHRIDEKIPDRSFQVEAGSSTQNLIRIHGIRDFYRQMAYWAYPTPAPEDPEEFNDANISGYPDKILAYNYLDQTFSPFNQKFRCFGYYRTFNDLTWDQATHSWDDADYAWDSPWQDANFPQVVAGDTNLLSGNVYIVYDFPEQSPYQDNPSYSIATLTVGTTTTITTTLNYQSNLSYFTTGTNVLINGVTGTVGAILNGNTYAITVDPINPFHKFSIAVDTSAAAYTSGGTITAVSNSNGGIISNYNYSIFTKRANPYLDEGFRCKLGFIDLYCTGTAGGQVTVNHYVDDNDQDPILVKTVDIDSSISDTKYVRVYLGAVARIHQIQITLSTTFPLNQSQLGNEAQGNAIFELQGLVWWTRRAGRIKTSNKYLT